MRIEVEKNYIKTVQKGKRKDMQRLIQSVPISICTLLLIGSFAVTACLTTSHIADKRPDLPKPSTPCSGYGRFVVKVLPVSTVTFGMVETDWRSMFDAFSTGSAIGGFFGGVSRAANTHVEVRDYAPTFERNVSRVIEVTSIQSHLISSVENVLRVVPPCETVISAVNDSDKVALYPSDQVLLVGLDLFFEGKNVSLISRLSCCQIDPSNFQRFVSDSFELKQFQDDKENRARLGLGLAEMKRSTQMLKVARRIQTYITAYDSFRIDSSQRTREEWLNDNGELLVIELKSSINILVPRLIAQLFPKPNDR